MNLSRSGKLDPAPGTVAIAPEELPPLPDDILTNPDAARIDPRQWFAHPDRPLEIEIGSGKGTFLVQQAAVRPETNYLGIEWAREYFTYACDRVRRHHLRNVRLLCADAVSFLRWRAPDACCRVIHLYFSDPWPKKKHHKNRVVRDEFLEHAWRVLEPQTPDRPAGELRIVTDHDGYWQWMQEHFARWCDDMRRFEREPFCAPDSAREGELVGTNFERKFRQEGRAFHAVTLRRRG